MTATQTGKHYVLASLWLVHREGGTTGFATTNVFTGEVEKEFDYATDAEVDEVRDTAQAAFEDWRIESYAERAVYMRKEAQLFRERQEDLAAIVTKENGATH